MKPEQITAWALDEASTEERQQLEAALRDNPTAKQAAEETKDFCHFLLAELKDESLAFTDTQRERLQTQPVGQSSRLPEASGTLAPRSHWRTGMVRLALAACVVLGGFWTWSMVETRRTQKALADRFTDADAIRIQIGHHGGPMVEAKPVLDARLLAEKPVKVVDLLEGLVVGKELAAAPAPAPSLEMPGMLALNAGAGTPTTTDVAELKKIQDQTAYGLNFGNATATPAPAMPGVIVNNTSVPASGPVAAFTPAKDASGTLTFGGTSQVAGELTVNSGGTLHSATTPTNRTSLAREATGIAAGSGAVATAGTGTVTINGGANFATFAPAPAAPVPLQLTEGIATTASGVTSSTAGRTGNMADRFVNLNEPVARPAPATPASLPLAGGVVEFDGFMDASNTMAGAGGTSKAGAGTLTLSGTTTTYTGATNVTAGALVVTNTAGRPATAAGATLDLNGSGQGMAQAQGVDLMSAPTVTTKTGTRATMEVTRSSEMPTEYVGLIVANPPPDAFYFEGERRGKAGLLGGGEATGDDVTKAKIVADPTSNETYTRIIENELKEVTREPLSTLSIDVDTASYANVRRFLNQNTMPPADAVRIEELVNYFPTAEEGPAHDAQEPFGVRVELAPCPWQPEHRLARIAIKGRELNEDRPASNLVFLVDVSGSMNEPLKLPLVQQSLRMLTEQLGEGDRVTMVVYAGSSGLVLPPTNGEKKSEILAAIDKLKAGGSTHGSAGIQLAYEQAVSCFIQGGVNRVILCTDGDFNVGVSSPEALEKLITQKAKSGVFLSVLGFGSGNLKDRTMETLADKGNGNYAYIDSLSEARKVLVEQMNGTLVTIAKDVKIQVEFNPAAVRSYRLIGYENRLLAKEDFNNDAKDAGEIGAGHSVVALYEIVPANLPPGAEPRPLVDGLKYQTAAAAPVRLAEAAQSGELMTVKLRYKEPEGMTSKLIEVPAKDEGKTLTASTEEFKFSAAVAGFGLLLRDSGYKGNLSWETVRKLAIDGKGSDRLGYRGEFLQLIDKARGLKGQ